MRRCSLWMQVFLLPVILIGILFFTRPASAQSVGPVYIVQPDDTLYSIAVRFNVSITDLMSANNIANPNLLSVGQQLVIPGLQGVTGVLDSEVVNFGDSFHSLVRRTQIPLDLLRRLNHVVSPTEFYVGASMIIPKQDNATDLTERITPAPGESLLELAVKSDTDAWTLDALNSLNGTWDGLPGDVLYGPGSGTSAQNASGLPSAFLSAQIPYLPLKQGGTAEIIIQPAAGVTLGGTLVDHLLNFFPMGDGRMVALQGVYVLLDPGVYPLELDATLPDGTKQSFEQMVLVAIGDQPTKPVPVPPEDPTLMASEDKQLASIVSPVTPTKYWQGKFSLPVGLPYCIKDWFGAPRSLTFQGSPSSYFHGGVDYGVCSPDHPLDIFAAAPGTVIFASMLNVRGNATIIDDGWGVYTIYAHQNAFGVTAGQEVQTGQVIGQIGATGHVTGPHLHFEMWVNGIQVNPLDWLNNTYP
jgi:murein DD-endopeptidase MepM/ murein hydrolase activator NlpD